MGKEINQITFEFTNEDEKIPKEFLSGNPIFPPPEKQKSTRGRKSLKELSEDIINVVVPDDAVLFEKQYYSIGDVAHMFHINSSVLRHWEGEFGLGLRKNKKGDRFFRPEDVKLVQLIYDLLRRRKFTIEGAKDFLKKNNQADEKYRLIQSLQKLKNFLLELKAHL
jgi:DNA-binding transcriptional MerR regulator